MPQPDSFILMGGGGFLVLLGIALLLWGRSEEKHYYDSLASRRDVREYLEHRPERPEPEALKIGGWIAITLGLVVLALGGALLLRG